MSGQQFLPICRTCHLNPSRLTSRRSQPPLALSVPLSRFTPRVGGGSAFYVRRHSRVLRFWHEGIDPFEAVSRFESGAEARQRYIPLWSRWRSRATTSERSSVRQARKRVAAVAQILCVASLEL